jgi:hypothetical protein
MLKKAIAAGVAAALLAVSLPVEASAASAGIYFYGPYASSHAYHNGHLMTRRCRTRYRWVGRPGHRHRVKVSTECHWVPLPPFHPRPPMMPKYPKYSH